MTDNFYDFDKDEMFSETYINKPKKRPPVKEYEIEIPAPRKIVATPVDSPMPRAAQRKPKKAQKMSSTALAFSIMGITVSCVLVFVLSTLAVIFGWRYIPKFEKGEKSVVEDVEKIEEYIEISDDGTYVEVVPYYKSTPDEEDSSSEADEDTPSETDEDSPEEEEEIVEV